MWVSLLVSLVLSVVSYAIQAAMAPKPKDPVAGQLDVPTAEEGGSIGVIFGTVLVKQSNVIWFGGARTIKIKSKKGKK